MAKTTCDWTVERLPWWVNGTLEEAEAERVAAHLAECVACREELAATRDALALYSAHLPVEALLDLIENEAAGSDRAGNGGELSREIHEVAAGHLGHCAACREELALLRESHAALAGEQAAEAPVSETAGRETREIETPGATVTPFVPRRAQPAPPVRRRRWAERRSLALAASLLLFAVSAGGWLTTGVTAERRGDRIADLERRLSELSATRTAGEPVGAEPVPDEAAAAALAAAAERQAAQASEIADLQAELEELRSAQESGERIADAVGIGPIEPWHLRPAVMRDGTERPGAPPIEVPAGADDIAFYLTGAGDRPLRLVVEEASSGQRLIERDLLTVFASETGPYVGFSLSLAGLPAGELRLRIFAGGDELGSRLLRIAR